MKFTIDTQGWTITPVDESGDARPAASRSWFDDDGFAQLGRWWLQASWQRKYSYQFRWLGRPIIQLPADILIVQDLIHRIRPTVIIETGIAHGGSAVLHASLLKALDGQAHPIPQRPHVIAIDIEIRPANRKALDDHPLRSMMTLIEGSSVDRAVLLQVRQALTPKDVVMVILDSNHTREHVLAELNAYAPMVAPGSAIVVMDGIMAELADLPAADRSWKMDNPAQAVASFLKSSAGKAFSVDQSYDGFALTHSPGGILLRSTS